MNESPQSTSPVPTLFEWVGGSEALRSLFGEFYRRVADDPLLASVFASMTPEHVQHVAEFVAEVFGGPTDYSSDRGGHVAMIGKHLGRSLTNGQRKRWVELLLECADDACVPADPEFRSALVAYLEWGSRLAVLNSQPGAEVGDPGPMPRWGWGEVGGPYQPG